MDQDPNQNDNLFNFDKAPQDPKPPVEPQTPAPGGDDIFPPPPSQPVSGGAQVYPAGDGFQQPMNPPAFTPPPPVMPAFTPPPPVKNNRTIWIIAIVAVVLLCCCCLGVAGVWAWNNGDQILNEYNSFVPQLSLFI